MSELIDPALKFLSSPEALLPIGMVVLLLLSWLPKLLAPYVAKHYSRLHPKAKAALDFVLPTLEGAVRNFWIVTYANIKVGVDRTPDDRDNEEWEKINQFVLSLIENIDPND